MKQQSPLSQLLLAFLIANFSFLTAYPQGEWKWAHAWTGSGGNPTYNQIFNNITNTAFDEEGNIYVYGTIGGGPELDGQHFLTNVPSEVQNPASETILLAKFDTLGNMLWHKIVKCNHNGGPTSTPLWMEVRDRKVFIAGTSTFWGYISYTSWLYYMDTLVRKSPQIDSIPESEQKPPYKVGSWWTFFAQFDLDGNLLEDHFVEAYTRERNLNGNQYPQPLCIWNVAPIHVDNNGNTYIYTYIEYEGNEEDPYTIVVDGDTNRTYDIYLPGTWQEGARGFLHNAMLYKFSPTWELVYAKRIVDHTEGIAASWEYLRDSINAYYRIFPIGLSFDEDDNMYLSGYLLVDMYDYDTGGHLHQYPIHVYWDSTHYATIYDMSGAGCMNFIIKYNTKGEVQWCNQMYTRGDPSDQYLTRVQWWKVSCLDGFLYLPGCGIYHPNGGSGIFFDSLMLQPLLGPQNIQTNIGFFVKYNAVTGQYVQHGVVPVIEGNSSAYPGPGLAVHNNRVFAMSTYKQYSYDLAVIQWENVGVFLNHIPFSCGESRLGSVNIDQFGDLLVDLVTYAPVTFSESVVAISNPGTDNAVFALYKNPEWATPYVGVPDRGGHRGDLKLWPNPTGHLIHVECVQSPMDYVTIMDLNGRMLMRETVRGSSATIDVSRLPAGTYILEAVGKGEVQTEKFIKTN